VRSPDSYKPELPASRRKTTQTGRLTIQSLWKIANNESAIIARDQNLGIDYLYKVGQPKHLRRLGKTFSSAVDSSKDGQIFVLVQTRNSDVILMMKTKMGWTNIWGEFKLQREQKMGLQVVSTEMMEERFLLFLEVSQLDKKTVKVYGLKVDWGDENRSKTVKWGSRKRSGRVLLKEYEVSVDNGMK
jgi:NhaP-type Na+/H+ and K+/H+ antiporter